MKILIYTLSVISVLAIGFNNSANIDKENSKTINNTFVKDTNTHEKIISKEVTKTDSIYADINGDGKKEAIWYEAAKLIENGEVFCADSSCLSVIKFSDSTIPPIFFTGYPYGSFELLGDVDDDKGEEIGFISLGYQSCWGNYTVWSLKNNNWKTLTDSISYYDCDEKYTPVKKDPNKKGYLLIETFENGNKRSKSIKIK